MEIIDNNKRGRNDGLLVASLVLIGLGLVVLARNLDFMDYWVYRTIVSWQSLLIVLGIWALARKNTTGGLILICLGAFFLIPRIARFSPDWIRIYWPVLLVFIGLIVLVNFFRSNARPRRSYNRHSASFSQASQATEEGYVNSYNSFSSAHHIVSDPVFRGAKIRNTFGGVVLDLRNTFLEGSETVIDIECTFGGIKILVPDNWAVVDQTRSFFGGVDDKRRSVQNDSYNANRIVIRGNLNFGGLEIRS